MQQKYSQENMVIIKFSFDKKELILTEKELEDGIKIEFTNNKDEKKYFLRLTPSKKGLVMN